MILDEIIELAKGFADEELELDWSEYTSILLDMELTSMEFFSFISEVEHAFDIKIRNREMNRIETLGDIADIVEARQE